jgi:hypothetical protein
MTTELFIPIKFRTTVILTPSDITKDFENTILNKLKNNYENICSKYGYIKKDTIKIIKRSVGQLKKEHFNANVYFDVVCIAEICNPAQGSIIKCKVKAKNSLGVLAEGYYDSIPILQIIIPKISAGIQSEINIDTISIGDEVKIEVCGKKYQLFDKHISIIGRAIKNKEEYIKNSVVDDVDIDEKGDDEIVEDIYEETESIRPDDDDEEKKTTGGDGEESEEEESDSENLDDEIVEDVEDEFEETGGGDCGDYDDEY